MLDKNVWIVIPAYNEAKNISGVISKLKEVTSNIVIVDDCSLDNTAEIVRASGVKLLHHIVNRGQGASLQTGTEFALSQDAEIIVHFDADGQMQVKEIANVIEPIVKGEAQIVFGSRTLSQANHTPWVKKYFIHFPAIIFNWLFTGIRLTDAHCGFRALSRNASEKIVITQDGMAHATEILDQVRLHDLKYQEVPVEILYHQYGQKFSSGFRIIRDLLLAKIVRK